MISTERLATLWSRWSKDSKGIGHWDFNHIEDGHCPNDVPTPKMPCHTAAWKGPQWAKEFVLLKGNVVHHITQKESS